MSDLEASKVGRVEMFQRHCLNVCGDMLCDGPQGHDGGCVFTPAWELVRRLEDHPAAAQAVKKADELLEDAWAREEALAELVRRLEDELAAEEKKHREWYLAVLHEVDPLNDWSGEK